MDADWFADDWRVNVDVNVLYLVVWKCTAAVDDYLNCDGADVALAPALFPMGLVGAAAAVAGQLTNPQYIDHYRWPPILHA